MLRHDPARGNSVWLVLLTIPTWKAPIRRLRPFGVALRGHRPGLAVRVVHRQRVPLTVCKDAEADDARLLRMRGREGTPVIESIAAERHGLIGAIDEPPVLVPIHRGGDDVISARFAIEVAVVVVAKQRAVGHEGERHHRAVFLHDAEARFRVLVELESERLPIRRGGKIRQQAPERGRASLNTLSVFEEVRGLQPVSHCASARIPCRIPRWQ